MPTTENNSKVYEKIIKQFLILLGLLFLSPILVNIALKAIKIYTQNYMYLLGYGLLIISIILIIYTVYFGFKTFKNLSNIIFQDE